MEASLYILIPLSVALVIVIAALFWWSLRSGQFDDLEGPAFRVLMEDDSKPEIDTAKEQLKE
ncbi:MAG: cbb3-type cytochrome oxidase assembly protein CcoS [Candidatus Dactylopiibacterium carminicum]|uniref:Cbb3-type cytochrome oxidase assembly protein CcoS n=1 Tax=Candidatus Dactylopiibacterium carminicum TaxID=857335 RepID=A0A272ENK6_9RHOO|nr:cbb3-type cytochrome oxidase assembly protein CcoS [Candidatus Dactylopiibacterium carminicum]KAF7599123.1 cbb3-type cytochrome oxidase assembly protein CcoS [Candidatus Dactylopiibacterium carminicum]PAS91697.1 MAG: cbb3-type cytochrome oxidase assembly protein CcoS [Candidatus Dactylopiibacterium carminicum]PAS99137.1 MAG: cytochrome oxidase maturation protein, cbb3-type [Candidatus Dactylopiibacterium carminicum]